MTEPTPPAAPPPPKPERWLTPTRILILGVIAIIAFIWVQGGSDNSAAGGDNVQGSPVTLSGDGTKDTAEFHLTGDYLVSWTLTPHSNVGCYHGANLKSSEVSAFKMIGNELLDNGQEKTGSTNLHDVEDADYYLTVNSGCRWRIIFTPQ